jgi:hypothetical protein
LRTRGKDGNAVDNLTTSNFPLGGRDGETKRAILTAKHAKPSPSLEGGHACERIADAFVAKLAGSDNADPIGPVLVRIWMDIESTLSPILGKRGVAALYNRSLQLSSASHEWLPGVNPGGLAEIDLEALETAFADEGNLEGIAAATQILRSFCSLLVSLVGVSLTERLIHPVVLHIQAGYPPEAL